MPLSGTDNHTLPVPDDNLADHPQHVACFSAAVNAISAHVDGSSGGSHLAEHYINTLAAQISKGVSDTHEQHLSAVILPLQRQLARDLLATVFHASEDVKQHLWQMHEAMQRSVSFGMTQLQQQMQVIIDQNVQQASDTQEVLTRLDGMQAAIEAMSAIHVLDHEGEFVERSAQFVPMLVWPRLTQGRMTTRSCSICVLLCISGNCVCM